MKNKVLKIWVLAIVLLLSLTCFFACNTNSDNQNDDSSETEIIYEYRVNDDNKTCTLTGVSGSLPSDIELPRKIDGYTLTKIGDYAFDWCTWLKSIKNSAFFVKYAVLSLITKSVRIRTHIITNYLYWVIGES